MISPLNQKHSVKQKNKTLVVQSLQRKFIKPIKSRLKMIKEIMAVKNYKVAHLLKKCKKQNVYHHHHNKNLDMYKVKSDSLFLYFAFHSSSVVTTTDILVCALSELLCACIFMYLTFQKNANYSVTKDFNNSSLHLFYEYLLCTKIRGLLSHLTLTLTF